MALSVNQRGWLAGTNALLFAVTMAVCIVGLCSGCRQLRDALPDVPDLRPDKDPPPHVPVDPVEPPMPEPTPTPVPPAPTPPEPIPDPPAPVPEPEPQPVPHEWELNEDGEPIADAYTKQHAALVKAKNGRRLMLLDDEYFIDWHGRWEWMRSPGGWSRASLWKADSDYGPLAVLLSRDYIWTARRAEIRRAGQVLDSANVEPPYIDGRPAFRFSRPGSGYGRQPAGLRVYLFGGGWVQFAVPTPHVRIENLKEIER